MPTSTPELLWLTTSAGVYRTLDRVVHLRGDDARSWLNGQVSNDVRELPPETARYALALTVKGRVVTDLWALDAADGMAIVLPATRTEAALARFDQHIIMEDVELTLDADLTVLTVQGPRAAEVIDAVADPLRRYACPRLGGAGFDCWVPRERADVALAALAQRAATLGGGVVDDTQWASAHVSLGVPRIAADFGEDAYPQEAGLGARALSFQKGCYTGQEVVYMLERRGQLARRLVQLEGDVAGAAPGAQLVDAEGKRLGEVTSLAPTADAARAVALGYLKRTAAEPGQTVWIAGSPWRVRTVVGAPAAATESPA
jgi:tRNA-modifying protein YgfZ